MKVPHFERFALNRFNWAPDPDAKLIYFLIVGGGGGGSGNQAANAIDYDQYGGVGQPSGIGKISISVTTTAGSSTFSAPGHQFVPNDPVYFDTAPAPFVSGQIYYVVAEGFAPNVFQLASTLFDAPLTTAVYAPRAQVPIVVTASGPFTANGYMWVAFGGCGGGVVGDEANPGTYARADNNGPSGYVQSKGLTGTTGENLYADPGHAIQGGRGGESAYGPGGGTGGGPGNNLTGAGGAGAYYVPFKSAAGGTGGGAGYVEGYIIPDGNPIPVLIGDGGAGGTAKNGGNAGGKGGFGVIDTWQFYDSTIVTNGLWTPTVIGSTVAGSPTYYAQAGQWSRVGDQVTIWFRVQINTPDPAASGSVIVSNLPFPPVFVPLLNYNGSVGPIAYVSHQAGFNQFGGQMKTTAGFTFHEMGDNMNILEVPITNMHVNALLGGSVTYRTNAP